MKVYNKLGCHQFKKKNEIYENFDAFWNIKITWNEIYFNKLFVESQDHWIIEC